MNAGTVQLDKLAADLAAAGGQQFKDVAAAIVTDGANQTLELARSYVPVKTSALRESLAITNVSPLTKQVGSDLPYAAFVEFGTGTRGEFPTGPIVIVPRGAQALRFQVGNKVVFTNRVVNPGMTSRPYLRPALERTQFILPTKMANAAVVFIVRGPQSAATFGGS